MGGYVQPICIFFFFDNGLDKVDKVLDKVDKVLDKVDNALDKVDKVLDYDDFLLGRFAFFLFAVYNPQHATTFFRFFTLWIYSNMTSNVTNGAI